MDEELEFIDAESSAGGYGKKFKLTFEEIVMRHLRQICALSCDEFRGGYTNKQIIALPGGMSTRNETYIQDARARYNQSVETLYDLIHSFFDKEMKAEDEKLKQEEKNCKTKDEVVIIKRKYFRALCTLLKRHNFLKETAYD